MGEPNNQVCSNIRAFLNQMSRIKLDLAESTRIQTSWCPTSVIDATTCPIGGNNLGCVARFLAA